MFVAPSGHVLIHDISSVGPMHNSKLCVWCADCFYQTQLASLQLPVNNALWLEFVNSIWSVSVSCGLQCIAIVHVAIMFWAVWWPSSTHSLTRPFDELKMQIQKHACIDWLLNLIFLSHKSEGTVLSCIFVSCFFVWFTLFSPFISLRVHWLWCSFYLVHQEGNN